MKRYLFILAFPLLFATCKDTDVAPDNPVVGRWSLVARQDSTGSWQPLLFPLESGPPTLEFRSDFSVDYINLSGEPQHGCCQPSYYSFVKPTPCPINASCLQTAGTIRFDRWTNCVNVSCMLPQNWTTINIDAKYMDIYGNLSNRLTPALRYQRIK